MAALVVSIIALVLSGVSLIYSRLSAKASDRSALASERSAEAAVAAERRARTPSLAITRGSVGRKDDLVIYTVRNDGPQDLSAVRVYRPRPADGITYPIAVTGENFAEDGIDLGPLPLNAEGRFTLACGTAAELPEFRVRIQCETGSDRWTLTALLDPPRPPKGPTVW